MNSASRNKEFEAMSLLWIVCCRCCFLIGSFLNALLHRPMARHIHNWQVRAKKRHTCYKCASVFIVGCIFQIVTRLENTGHLKK